MRKFILLAAAVPLLFAPAASAADKKAEHRSVCRVPDVDLDYDTATFTTIVKLPASGCASREHTIFTMSAAITRIANQGGDRDLVQRSVQCGPLRSADDVEVGEEAPQYFCDLALFLDHSDEEQAEYHVDVTYPGAAAERTMSVFTFCTSDGQTASCEQ